jgi:hypothetical protein
MKEEKKWSRDVDSYLLVVCLWVLSLDLDWSRSRDKMCHNATEYLNPNEDAQNHQYTCYLPYLQVGAMVHMHVRP